MFEIETIEKKVESLGRKNLAKVAFKKSLKKMQRNESNEQDITTFLPKVGEMSLLKTNGLTDAGNIFYAIDKHEKATELYLATWIINKNNIDNIVDNPNLQKRTIILSNRLKQLKKADYNYMLEKFAKIENADNRFRICNAHAKTFSIRTAKDNYYTIIGSANWTENPRIEVYHFHNDKEIFDWNKEWMKDLIK